MRVKILRKCWDLVFDPHLSRKHRGECDPPTNTGKRIRIRSTLRGEEKLEVIIHEIIHAADWTKDEEWVHDVANDMARILTRLGYTDDKEV